MDALGSQCASVRSAYIQVYSVPSGKENLNFTLRQQIRLMDCNIK